MRYNRAFHVYSAGLTILGVDICWRGLWDNTYGFELSVGRPWFKWPKKIVLFGFKTRKERK